MGDDVTEASQPVSDDELDRAADEAVAVVESSDEEVVETTDEVAVEAADQEVVVEGEGEIGEEVVAAAEIPAEPDKETDNAERSRLGRKVQELESTLLKERDENRGQINAVLERMDKLIGKDQPEEEDDFILPESKAELAELVTKTIEDREASNRKAKTQETSQYQTDYVDTVQDLIDDETEEVRTEILKRLGTDDYNLKHSANGSRDAAKNIKNVIKSLGSKEKSVPLKQANPRSPLGGGGKDKIPAKVIQMPKLDPDAKAFMESTGMSEEDVAKALDGEAPAYIRG